MTKLTLATVREVEASLKAAPGAVWHEIDFAAFRSCVIAELCHSEESDSLATDAPQ